MSSPESNGEKNNNGDTSFPSKRLKTEVKVVKVEVTPELKAEVKAEVKDEFKPEVKDEFKPEVKDEFTAEVKPTTSSQNGVSDILTLGDIGNLPEEVFRNIVARLPIQELMKSRLVCKYFDDIIISSDFMAFKRYYYQYKDTNCSAHQAAKQFVENIVGKNISGLETWETGLKTCIINLIHWANGFRKSQNKELEEELQKCHSYETINSIFRGNCFNNSQDLVSGLGPYAHLAASIFMAKSAFQVSNLLSFLTKIDAPLIIDFFYGTALLLLAYERLFGLPNKHHYMVFTALYWQENETAVNRERLREIFDRHSHGQFGPVFDKFVPVGSKVQLTQEQLKIVEQDIGPGETMKITAFAGTGKTTTLIRYAQTRPNLRFLYVAYNKQIVEDAKTRFSSNVTPATTHSLAWEAIGISYHNSPKKNNKEKFENKLSLYHIMDGLPQRHLQGFNTYKRATAIKKTIERYFASADLNLGLCHVPSESSHKSKRGEIEVIPLDRRYHYLEEATQLWYKMQDRSNTSIPMTYDGYLKLYQLSKPRVSYRGEMFDVFLIDEAQDMSPCQIDIFQNQQQANAAKIWVGDPHQQIYCFRGAVDAMAGLQATHAHSLTQSFRFGPNIALASMSLLQTLKKVNGGKTLVGMPIEDSILGDARSDTTAQTTIICRTNFKVYSEADAVTSPEYSHFWSENGTGPRPKIHIYGTAEQHSNYFSDVMDLLHLMNNRRCDMESKRFSRYLSFKELEKDFIASEDIEVLGKIDFVRQYKERNLPEVLQRLRCHMTPWPGCADFILTTAHKAKGLEFDTVKVSDDFVRSLVSVRNFNSINIQHLKDESNMLYVAASRAKKHLILSDMIIAVLQHVKETFCCLVENNDNPQICAIPSCQQLCPSKFVLRRSAVSTEMLHQKGITDINSVTENAYCCRCSHFIAPHLSPLLPPFEETIDKETAWYSHDQEVWVSAVVKLQDANALGLQPPSSKNYFYPSFRLK